MIRLETKGGRLVIVQIDVSDMEMLLKCWNWAFCFGSSLNFNEMSSFGRVFRITTFGESHGKGVGVIIDGVPPNLRLTEDDIQPQLTRRRPGQSALTTPVRVLIHRWKRFQQQKHSKIYRFSLHYVVRFGPLALRAKLSDFVSFVCSETRPTKWRFNPEPSEESLLELQSAYSFQMKIRDQAIIRVRRKKKRTTTFPHVLTHEVGI